MRGFWFGLILLLVSLPSALLIPQGPIRGMDLQNLYAFHACDQARVTPYGVNGSECRDIEGRGMVYPPILYWSFLWLRPLTQAQAYFVWLLASIAIVAVSLKVWGGSFWKSKEQLAWSLFILPQLPLAFALERGNNDLLVVLTWTLAFWSYERRQMRAVGFWMGMSVLLKVYAIIAVVPVAIALIWGKRAIPQTSMFKLLSMLIMTIAGGLFLFWNQSLQYFIDILPGWAGVPSSHPGLHHSLPTRFGQYPGLVPLLLMVMVGAWSWAGFQTLKNNSDLIFAGALGISTYFSGIAYDYSLVTVYPFFFVLARRALGAGEVGTRERVFWAGWFCFGVAAVLGLRHLLRNAGGELQTLQLASQVVFWIGVAVWLTQQRLLPSAIRSSNKSSED